MVVWELFICDHRRIIRLINLILIKETLFSLVIELNRIEELRLWEGNQVRIYRLELFYRNPLPLNKNNDNTRRHWRNSPLKEFIVGLGVVHIIFVKQEPFY
jgi:hypothetical protein